MRSLIDLTLSSQWNGGYVMEVFITNLGSDPITDYRIGFTTHGTLGDVWGGSLLTADAGYYEIGDDDAKNDIAPGETARFKIKVLGDGTEFPAGFTVNGETPSLTDAAAALVTPVDPLAELPEAYVFVDGVSSVDTNITAEQLQTLIDNAPEGASIHFAAGEYHFDAPLAIERSDLSLVGAGSAETRFLFSEAALADGASQAIRVQGGDAVDVGTLQDAVGEGSDQLVLGDGHGLAAGDTIRLYQNNDAAFLDAIGDSQWRETDSPLRTSMARVVAVDGDTVTLDRGVHFDFAAGDTHVERIDTLDHVSLSGFGVGFTLGEPDAGDFVNQRTDLLRYHAIEFDATVGAEIRDVAVTNGPSTAFEFARSLDMTAESLSTHGSFNKGGGGNGYGFELRESYDGQYDDLTSLAMRHGVLFASWSSSVGNSINVALTDRDINFHGGRDHANTVHVEQSLRDAAHDEMSTTLWVNDGESFGAPTDGDANTVTFDYVVGTRRDDIIHGTDAGVYLDGALGHDHLYGGAGDDILRGGAGWGNDVLDGGDGFDIAVFDQAFGDYHIANLGNDRWYLDGPGDDDILIDMEEAHFADGRILDLRTGELRQGEVFQVPSAETILGDGDATSDTSSSLTLTGGDWLPTGTTVTDAGNSDALSYTLTPVSRWSSGYVMRVTLSNHGDHAVEASDVAFDLNADLTQLYSATLTRHEAGHYTVTPDGDGMLAAGDSLSFSFKAYADESMLPASLTLGGQAVTLDDSDLCATTAVGTVDADALTRVTTQVKSEWSSGYVGEVIVENTSDATLDDISLAFDLPSGLSALWNAQVVDADGSGHYVVTDDTPLSLAPGEAWRFSYKTYDAAKALPTQLDVDGTASDIMATAAGGDEWIGTDGADTFAFRATQASGPDAPDRILDFLPSQGDVIDLSAIDADLAQDGDQAFVWRGSDSFTGQGGELRLADGMLRGDVNGDGVADLAIELTGIGGCQDDLGLVL
ncbi:cellulose binding domain-containing protein [Modicisalibacter tunisiensis]|uniref:Cellulose binding domain-containing protein n=1 Tax=Modicisalibacter tunisiensis TaxID=390637 RepID=A0ABS7WY03_9GAMM|nr:cellulose binding domain-containing protein [Modicisalibacter tunisiensis]MBZ9567508.1 cellulose binding domain-containing protein [Modicisalibacter tunisiensis]